MYNVCVTKKSILVFFIGGIAVVGLVAAASYEYVSQKNKQSGSNVACAQEAMICPDGSSVGRTGPKCEFAKCPDIPTHPAPINGDPIPANHTAPQTNTPPANAASMKLIFKYGVGAKNALDTFAGTYTKDMVIDPSITVPFHLTEDERARIFSKINELKVFDQKQPAPLMAMMNPCSGYYLKVHTDSYDKDLSWSNCSGKTIAPAWNTFSEFMISLIESKDEYKKLPKTKSEYL